VEQKKKNNEKKKKGKKEKNEYKEKYVWEKKSELPSSLKCIRNLKSFKI
jgi:hypothetical protein